MRTSCLAVVALGAAACHPALIGGAIAGGGGGGGSGGPADQLSVQINSFTPHVAPGARLAAEVALGGRTDRTRQLTFWLDCDGDLATDPSFPLTGLPIAATGGTVAQVSLTVPDNVGSDQYYLVCAAGNPQLGSLLGVSACRITVSHASPVRDLEWRNAHAATGVHRVVDSDALFDGTACVVGWWSGDLYAEGATEFERCKGRAGLYIAMHEATTGAVVSQGLFSSDDAEIYARGVVSLTSVSDYRVVVVGEFRGLAFFGIDDRSSLPVNRQSRIVNNSPTLDAFVAIYVRRGNAMRVEDWFHLAGDGDVRALGVHLVPGVLQETVAVTGQFGGTLQLGPLVSITARGSSDVFLLSMRTVDGGANWAVRGGGDQPMTAEAGTSVSATALDIGGRREYRIAVTGQVRDADAEGITFTNADGSVPPHGRLTGHSDAADAFTAVYDAGGTLEWLVRAGGEGEDVGRSVVISPDSGSVYTVGDFRGTAYFDGAVGPGIALTSLAANGADPNGFVVKHDQVGSVVWAQLVGSTAAAAASDVTLFDQPDDAVGVCGWFLGDASLRSAGGTTAIGLRSYGDSDMFALRLQVLTGAPVDARNIGGAGPDLAFAMTAHRDLSHCVVGEFASTSLACGTLPAVGLAPSGTRSGSLVMKVKQP